MTDTNEALGRLLAQVGAHTDALVGGTPVQARQVLAEAAVALAGRAAVVSVASPIGELSLSALIAQLSGRLDLDEQDDAVLELGFKRLQGEGQTVLTVLAPCGVSRSALRYIQHVSRQSPGLVLVMYAAPPLAAMLAEPGFAALHARLHASPAVRFEVSAEIVTTRSVAIVPAPLPPRPRRRVLWAVSALGVAATAAIVWLGYQTPGTAVAGSRVARADRPLVPASVSLPVPARLGDPLAADLPSLKLVAAALPPLAKPVPAAVARPPQIALATLPAQPPSMPLAHTDTAVASPARPPNPTRRDPVRVARARPYWPAPRYREPAEYEAARPWDGVSPIWVRRNPYRRDAPYLGTYAVDPNGVRVFQYDP